MLKPSIKTSVIVEDLIEEIEETLPPFKHKEEELEKNVYIS